MFNIKTLDPVSQTKDICLLNIESGVPLHYVRLDLRTEELCLKAVEYNMMNIIYVPSDVLTEEMVFIAASYIGVCKKCRTIIPKRFLTDSLYVHAINEVKSPIHARTILTNIPIKQRTYTICLAAVQRCGPALNFVPKELRDENIILTALRTNGLALQYIDNPSLEMCKIAVKSNHHAMKYVPQKYLKKSV